MRIVLVNTLYTPLLIGGAEKSVALLAEALVRHGDKVTVVTLSPDAVETFAEVNGVSVYRVPLYNRYWPFNRKEKSGTISRILWHLADMWNLRAARRVGQILDKEKPDVVHTNNILGFSVAIWREVKKRHIRLVHTLRDYYMLCVRCALFRNGKVCERRCGMCKVLTYNRRTVSSYPDAVVSNSQFVLDVHSSNGYFNDVKASVIFNIMPGSSSRSAEIEEPRQSGPLTFGYIGRVEDEKGIKVVLEATRLLNGQSWRLKIAGSGLEEYVTALREKYVDDRIEWLGFMSAQEFYRSIDVTLVSSVWSEPLPRTLIETFAAGKGAICARSGGIPEIAQLGRAVATYPATDEAALAQIMDDAIADPETWRNGGFVSDTALEAFSESAVVEKYRNVYSQTTKI